MVPTEALCSQSNNKAYIDSKTKGEPGGRSLHTFSTSVKEPAETTIKSSTTSFGKCGPFSMAFISFYAKLFSLYNERTRSHKELWDSRLDQILVRTKQEGRKKRIRATFFVLPPLVLFRRTGLDTYRHHINKPDCRLSTSETATILELRIEKAVLPWQQWSRAS